MGHNFSKLNKLTNQQGFMVLFIGALLPLIMVAYLASTRLSANLSFRMDMDRTCDLESKKRLGDIANPLEKILSLNSKIRIANHAETATKAAITAAIFSLQLHTLPALYKSLKLIRQTQSLLKKTQQLFVNLLKFEILKANLKTKNQIESLFSKKSQKNKIMANSQSLKIYSQTLNFPLRFKKLSGRIEEAILNTNYQKQLENRHSFSWEDSSPKSNLKWLKLKTTNRGGCAWTLKQKSKTQFQIVMTEAKFSWKQSSLFGF